MDRIFNNFNDAVIVECEVIYYSGNNIYKFHYSSNYKTVIFFQFLTSLYCNEFNLFLKMKNKYLTLFNVHGSSRNALY